MFGLPGGSSNPGPASTAGLILVFIVTAFIVYGLVQLLFRATDFL